MSNFSEIKLQQQKGVEVQQKKGEMLQLSETWSL